MQINSIIDIVGGELFNSPSISFIYNIKTDPTKVMEGDLFIAKNEADIFLAVKKGAFAVITDFYVSVSDNEIAWIKVDSITNALIKLFRFKLSTVDLKAFYCDDITFNLFDIYKTNNKSIKLISENLEESIKVIENVLSDDILFCSNKMLLNKICPNNHDFNATHNLNNLIQHSLFETSFSYEEKYFSKLKISSLYINQFIDVYNFLEEELEINRLKKLNHFKPIFIDKFLSVIEYGKSDKFILCQKNIHLVNKEISYIKNRYRYAKTLYITNNFIDNFNEAQYVLPDLKDLKKFLKNKKFNCIYIIGYDYSEVEYILSQSNQNQTLL